VSQQIALALEKARRKKFDKDNAAAAAEDGPLVDNDEARELFPMSASSSLMISSENDSQKNGGAAQQGLKRPIDDAAWDTGNASDLTSMLEESKARNKANAEQVDSSRPLLHLETISSSQNNEVDREEEEEASSKKLMSQKERLAMYTSGRGFGVGDDSSVDNDDEDDDENDESRRVEEDDERSSSSSEGDDEDDANEGVEVSPSYNAKRKKKKKGEVVFDYKDMNNMMDDSTDAEEEEEEDYDDGVVVDEFQFVPHYDKNVPTFSTDLLSNTDRTRRWDRNPDAMSDVCDDDDESDFYIEAAAINKRNLAKSKTASYASVDGSSTVAGLGTSTVGSTSTADDATRQIRNTHRSSSTESPPTIRPHSPPLPQSTPPLVDQVNNDSMSPNNGDVTPKIGSSSSGRKANNASQGGKLFAIPPPPPEKLRQWEESKAAAGGGGKPLLLLSGTKFVSEEEGGSSAAAGAKRSEMVQQAGNDIERAMVQQQAVNGIELAPPPPPPPPLPSTSNDPSPRLQENRKSPNLNNHHPYKIHFPKSPAKKKPQHLIEEFDKRMAEKIALASSKAARKFEQEYANNHLHNHNGSHHGSPRQQLQQGHHSRQHSEEGLLGSGNNAATTPTSSESRFFCTGEVVAPLISESREGTPESADHNMKTAMHPSSMAVGELVGGAFSPWKIPDRVDDDGSSIASSANKDLSYENAAAAAVSSIRAHRGDQGGVGSKAADDSTLNESFEVSLDEVHLEEERGGALTHVLQWLFSQVLPQDSPIATAFSAFDIHTSTTVQADRVLAIVKDDDSLNTICAYVAKEVGWLGANKAKADSSVQLDSQRNEVDDTVDNVSVSTYESSNVTTSSISDDKPSTFSQKAAERILKGKKRGGANVALEPFEIPTMKGGGGRPSADVLATNFVGFLQQISNVAEIPSPYGNDNPFLYSVVHNLTSSKKQLDIQPQKRERSKTTMQDLVFANEEQVVTIFQFLWMACGSKGITSSSGAEDNNMKHWLSAIEEGDANDGPKTTIAGDAITLTPIVPNNAPGLIVESKTCSPSDLNISRGSQQRSTIRKSNRQRKNTSFTSKNNPSTPINLNLVFPNESPSPFETAVWNQPSIVVSILSFLGNPVAVCVMKRLNVFCNRVVTENQHVLMRDAVRLGGMSKYVRPSFWLWVTERKCKLEDPIPLIPSRRGFDPTPPRTKKSPGTNSATPQKYTGRNFLKLKEIGGSGKWQHVIERDVTRAFGNMPPHKTGARYRQDSIVRALVSFGKEEIMRNSRSYQTMDKLPEEKEAKHFKLSSRLDNRAGRGGDGDDSSNGGGGDSSGSLTPTDTVSDWGGISPVGSMIAEDESVGGNTTGDQDRSMNMISYDSEILDTSSTKPHKLNLSQLTSRSDVSDPALSGNALTSEMKVDLQNKLRSILHALAARHEAVGYCQGMDYVVAHLLRVLQDTILLRVVQRSMPASTSATQEQQDKLDNLNKEKSTENTGEDWRAISSDELRARMSDINSQSAVVEEAVFNVMDTFFLTYNLQHMYWPELRCLKTCCRVFESLIEQKLPVLADHFRHYDLNVGLFALGWFQTLFLYLPSMPSTTVCHIWDIWLVERSFKIFFRVGTAILFLSQPTLLNHDDDGMMTYLNTFPDATLMRRDILIPCALQIKITNRMLVEIEKEVTMSAMNSEENCQFHP